MNLTINNYPGSKGASGLAQWIINHIPDCEVFVEAFGGSGVVTHELAKQKVNALLFLNEIYYPVFKQLEKKFEHGFYRNKVTLQNIDSINFYCFKHKEPTLYNGTVFYFDPPYLKETRRSQKDIYGKEWNYEDHRRFLNLVGQLHKNGARIIISHPHCEFYDVALEDWYTDSVNSMTRGGKSVETIFCNFDRNEYPLLCAAFVGDDFTDRQRVKRKKEALAKKLNALPLHEKQAIISHINKVVDIA